MSEERVIRHSVIIRTTPELAFEAVTQASELREWLCDEAWTDVRRGGRFEVRWTSGYRAEGRFTEVDAPRRAAITWLGRGEPGETAVEFNLHLTESGVDVTVVHRGFGPGAEWASALEQADAGWAAGLENLKSTLETGVDLRVARQPFMGIYLGLLTPERAAREGIAAEWGIYVEGTAEGSGAAAAGLARGDVIVGVGGMETPGLEELGVALRAHRAGETVDVDLVRGQARLTVPLTLGQRPQPEVPATAAELAERLAELHAEVNADLQAAVEGLTEAEAEQQPAEAEWSVKQVLAHLSDSERGTHTLLPIMAVNGWFDAAWVYPDQVPGRLEAVLAVAPTLDGLVDRFLTDEAETVALVRGLPATTLAHKARFRRIGQQVIAGPAHSRDHIEQIKQAVEAVRGAKNGG